MSKSPALGESKWTTVPQGRVHYREIGNGDPLIFIHGVVLNGEFWREVVPFLSTKYRCICPDLPFGGHSEPLKSDADLSIYAVADIIYHFAESLNLPKKPTFIANDSGGALTQIMIARHPDVAGRLVFTSCDCFDNFPPGIYKPLPYLVYIPGFVWLIYKVFSNKTLSSSKLGFGLITKKGFPDDMLGCFMAQLSKPSQRHDLGKIFRGVSPRYTNEASKKFHLVNAPVLIAWSKEDPIFPLSDGQKLEKLFPNARLETIENSYCYVAVDNPRGLAESVLKFLEQNPLS